MKFTDLKISLDQIVNDSRVDIWKSYPPRNPKFKVGQDIKIKLYQNIITKDTGEKRDYINAIITKSRYSEALEGNMYEILIEGSIQEFVDEKVLIDYIKIDKQ